MGLLEVVAAGHSLGIGCALVKVKFAKGVKLLTAVVGRFAVEECEDRIRCRIMKIIQR